jgi:hypothetical protein
MSALEGSNKAAGLRLLRLVDFTPLAILAVVLVWKLQLILGRWAWAVGYPYELDYGEGIVWEQMRKIVAGHAYGPIDGFPAIVFHYPPIYHLLTTLLSAATGLDGLAAGRLLSAAATLVAAGLIGLLASELVVAYGRRAQSICAVAASLIALNCLPITAWAPLMRVDMVATALTLAGFYLTLRALKRPKLVYVGAFCFVAAVYTKQTMIAAPSAAYLTLLIMQPRLAIRGILTALALGGVALIGLTLATDGGFIRHVFLYNVNRFDAAQLRQVPGQSMYHAVFLIAAAVGVSICWWSLITSHRKRTVAAALEPQLSSSPVRVTLIACTIYLLIASAMLVLVGKVGANINYLVEWFAVLSTFAGAGCVSALALVDDEFAGTRFRAAKVVFAGVLPLALAAQAMLLWPPQKGMIEKPVDDAEALFMVEMVRHADRPVISDDMVSIIKGGKEVVWESAIFAELQSTGVYDERPFVQMIKDRRFAFFATPTDRTYFHTRYTPAVSKAIEQGYPIKRDLGPFVLHLPRDAAGLGKAKATQ